MIPWLLNPDGTPGKTWNPVTGCTPVSPGCANCYAKAMSRRRMGEWKYRDFSDVRCHMDRLLYPLRWKKPRGIFLCSMGDLFHYELSHYKIPFHFVARVFSVIKEAERHTFFILTKRPERMHDFLMEYKEYQYMENVYFGVSAENQHAFDKRLPWLVNVPVRFMFMSLEPLLGPVILRHYTFFDWCIVGAETGPKRRKMDVDWARDIRDGCLKGGMPFFFKQGTGGKETLDGVSHHAMPAKYLK